MPRPDEARDPDEWRAFLRAHPFGQLVAAGGGREVPVISPAPFILEPDDTLLLHLSTPNPIWAAIEENPLVVLAVTGDSTYVTVRDALLRRLEKQSERPPVAP